MQNDGTAGFWRRLWSALIAIEGQHAEQADLRLAKLEADLANIRPDAEGATTIKMLNEQ